MFSALLYATNVDNNYTHISAVLVDDCWFGFRFNFCISYWTRISLFMLVSHVRFLGSLSLVVITSVVTFYVSTET